MPIIFCIFGIVVTVDTLKYEFMVTLWSVIDSYNTVRVPFGINWSCVMWKIFALIYAVLVITVCCCYDCCFWTRYVNTNIGASFVVSFISFCYRFSPAVVVASHWDYFIRIETMFVFLIFSWTLRPLFCRWNKFSIEILMTCLNLLDSVSRRCTNMILVFSSRSLPLFMKFISDFCISGSCNCFIRLSDIGNNKTQVVCNSLKCHNYIQNLLRYKSFM